MSFVPLYRITNRMTAGLTRIERARGFLEAARLSEDWLATMRSRALLLEAHHTTHIEGTRLTLEQAERLLAGETVAGTDPDDARELLNYRVAFEFVSGYLNDGGPMTEGLIREIHRRLVAGVRGGAAAPREIGPRARAERNQESGDERDPQDTGARIGRWSRGRFHVGTGQV